MRLYVLLAPLILLPGACSSQGADSPMTYTGSERHSLSTLLQGTDRPSIDYVQKCDEHAAHPDDPDKASVGVTDESMNIDLAIRYCTEALEQDPSARLAGQLGRAFLMAGRYGEAMETLTTAAEEDWVPAFYYIAVAYDMGLVQDEAGNPLSQDEVRESVHDFLTYAALQGFRPAQEVLGTQADHSPKQAASREHPGVLDPNLEKEQQEFGDEPENLPSHRGPTLRRPEYIDAFFLDDHAFLEKREESVLQFLLGVHAFLTDHVIFYPDCVGLMDNFSPVLIKARAAGAALRKLKTAPGDETDLPREARLLWKQIRREGTEWIPREILEGLEQAGEQIPDHLKKKAYPLAESLAIRTISGPALQQDGKNDALLLASAPEFGCRSDTVRRIYANIRNFIESGGK